jgi:hypothetical protein
VKNVETITDELVHVTGGAKRKLTPADKVSDDLLRRPAPRSPFGIWQGTPGSPCPKGVFC